MDRKWCRVKKCQGEVTEKGNQKKWGNGLLDKENAWRGVKEKSTKGRREATVRRHLSLAMELLRIWYINAGIS